MTISHHRGPTLLNVRQQFVQETWLSEKNDKLIIIMNLRDPSVTRDSFRRLLKHICSLCTEALYGVKLCLLLLQVGQQIAYMLQQQYYK